MNATILSGAAPGDTELLSLQTLVSEELRVRGASPTAFLLEELCVRPCRSCFCCWVKTPGRCVIADDAQELARASIQADVLVFVSRLSFGGYGWALKQAVERLMPLITPFFTRVKGELCQRSRYPRAPSLLGVGLQGEPDLARATTFQTLLATNGLYMHSPLHRAVVLDASHPEAERAARIGGLFDGIGGGA